MFEQKDLQKQDIQCQNEHVLIVYFNLFGTWLWWENTEPVDMLINFTQPITIIAKPGLEFAICLEV